MTEIAIDIENSSEESYEGNNTIPFPVNKIKDPSREYRTKLVRFPSNEEGDEGGYKEPSLLDICRASWQPGFTYIDAEIKAGNRRYLTPLVKIAGLGIESGKLGIYALILSNYF